MIKFLAIGTALGLAAGWAPGPLSALVIAETLQHDIKSGVRVALAPMITDLPIIILTLFVLSKLAHFNDVLGIIALLGGCFILFMGYRNIRTAGIQVNVQEMKTRSLTKGVLANFLSPHPYLFWFCVGGPTVNTAMRQGITAPMTFILSFYAVLVGSKVMMAIVVDRSKSFLTSKYYIYVLRLLGFVLCVLAIVLFRDGLNLLKII